MLMNVHRIKTMLNEISRTPFLFMTGILALLMGLLIVVSHNIWVADWRVIITILGWLILVKGIVRLFLPEFAFRMMISFVQNIVVFYVTDIILLGLGIYLSYVGFIA